MSAKLAAAERRLQESEQEVCRLRARLGLAEATSPTISRQNTQDVLGRGELFLESGRRSLLNLDQLVTDAWLRDARKEKVLQKEVRQVPTTVDSIVHESGTEPHQQLEETCRRLEGELAAARQRVGELEGMCLQMQRSKSALEQLELEASTCRSKIEELEEVNHQHRGKVLQALRIHMICITCVEDSQPRFRVHTCL